MPVKRRNPDGTLYQTKYRRFVQEAEKDILREALLATDGEIASAGKLLELSRSQMSATIKRLGLRPFVYDLTAKALRKKIRASKTRDKGDNSG